MLYFEDFFVHACSFSELSHSGYCIILKRCLLYEHISLTPESFPTVCFKVLLDSLEAETSGCSCSTSFMFDFTGFHKICYFVLCAVDLKHYVGVYFIMCLLTGVQDVCLKLCKLGCCFSWPAHS